MVFENRKKETLINLAKNTLATILVLSIVAGAIFLVQGWTIDQKGETKLTGLTQFISNPTGATVKINGSELEEKTHTKKQLEPGIYNFEISRSGYKKWSRTAQIEAGKILWLNYARLIPEKIKTESFFNFAEVKDIIFSEDKKIAIILAKNQGENFKLFSINLEAEKPKLTEIIIPNQILSKAQEAPDLSFLKFQKINHDGKKLIATWQNGEVFQNIVVNTQNPEKSINLTEDFHLDFKNITPSNKDFSKFFALTNGDLREVDLEAKTVSANIATGVVDFKIYNSDTLLISKKISENEFQTEIITKSKKTKISTIKSQPKIAIGRYYNENYVHILEGRSLKIYKGNEWHDRYRPKFYKEFLLDFDAQEISLNSEMRILIIKGLEKNQTIDLESETAHNLPKNFNNWLDNFIIFENSNGAINIRDFDNHNPQTIVNSQNLPVSLSSNEKFLFSIGKNKNNELILNKSRLILE